MSNPVPGSDEWLAQVQEEIIEPDRPIIDTHHHLWDWPGNSYQLEELWSDTESGHRIEKTIFMECHASYRTEGPEHLKPLGETEFVTAIAEASAKGGKGKAVISAIIGHADLTLGDAVEEVLDGQVEVSHGLFRGIRHAGARDDNPEALFIPGGAPEGLYLNKSFQRGMAALGRRGFTYDTWHYHHQNRDFLALARAVPDTTMVLDHFGTPLGVGAYQNKREEIYQAWKEDIAEISRCPNVVAKLGGLAMPDNGFGWNQRAMPPTSDEFVAAQARYYLHTIECFGVDRCMFESNFPVDRLSLSYHVLWNGFKKLVADFSEQDKDALFRGTAERVYKL